MFIPINTKNIYIPLDGYFFLAVLSSTKHIYYRKGLNWREQSVLLFEAQNEAYVSTLSLQCWTRVNKPIRPRRSEVRMQSSCRNPVLQTIRYLNSTCPGSLSNPFIRECIGFFKDIFFKHNFKVGYPNK